MMSLRGGLFLFCVGPVLHVSLIGVKRGCRWVCFGVITVSIDPTRKFVIYEWIFLTVQHQVQTLNWFQVCSVATLVIPTFPTDFIFELLTMKVQPIFLLTVLSSSDLTQLRKFVRAVVKRPYKRKNLWMYCSESTLNQIWACDFAVKITLLTLFGSKWAISTPWSIKFYFLTIPSSENSNPSIVP